MGHLTIATELQQFLCAANWMRQSIPEFVKLAAPLYATLDRAADAIKSRRKTKLMRVLFSESEWSSVEDTAFEGVKRALVEMVPLAHPSTQSELCLYTDTSQDFWGAVLTQLEPDELRLPLSEQNHKPFAFLSGRFVEVNSRWATIEKEAFAIVESIPRLEYLLRWPAGFRLYTDHRNLVYIFSPSTSNGVVVRYQADKFQR